jgi:hypothetical protein
MTDLFTIIQQGSVKVDGDQADVGRRVGGVRFAHATTSRGISSSFTQKQKKKTPALLHGVFRRGENAPSRQMLSLTYVTLTKKSK